MQYEIFFKEALSPFVLLDSKGRIIDWNKGSEEVFGWGKEEVQGDYDPTFTRTSLLKLIDDVKKKGKIRGRYHLRKKNGDIWESEVTAVHKDGFIYILKRDLTHERYAYIERMKAIGELISGIAHQLNSPLSSIILMAEMLKEELTGEALKDLELIEKQAKNMKQFIERILHLAKPSSKKSFLCFADVVKDILTVYENTLSHKGIKVRITYECKSRNLTCRFLGDRNALEQIIVNLLSNSVDAMPQGGKIDVRCWMEKGCVHLTVADTGHGMKPEVMERIFDPFFTTKGSRGTGLGLTIVKRIVDDHGGKIKVESKPGKGTKFHIIFPLEKKKKNGER